MPIEMVLLFDLCSVPYFVRLLDGMFSRLCIWSLLRAPCLGISKSGRLQALCWVLPGNALKMGMFKSSSVVLNLCVKCDICLYLELYSSNCIMCWGLKV